MIKTFKTNILFRGMKMQPDFFEESFHYIKKGWPWLLVLMFILAVIFQSPNSELINMKFGFIGGLVIFFILGLIRFFAKNTAYKYRENKQERQNNKEWKKRTDAEEKQHQIVVRRERDILQARADVQIDTMQRLHAQNVSVERQLMDLRKELQSIENEENRAFMEDMIRQAENSLRK